MTVEVRAAGVNPVDYKLLGGMLGTDPGRLPMPVGLEPAGVVTEVGPDAVGPAGPVAVGDEVVAYPASGAFADRVTVPAANVVPRPAGLGWPEAAGYCSPGGPPCMRWPRGQGRTAAGRRLSRTVQPAERRHQRTGMAAGAHTEWYIRHC